ncbi:MAG: helix-turn-helix transcriptional regulator [Pseudomonadota bacterium]
MFLFHGLSAGVGALAQTFNPDAVGLLFRFSVLVGGLEATLPLLLWVYVRALTTEGQPNAIPKLRYHVIPIVLVVLAFWSLLFLPDGFAETEFDENDPGMPGYILIALAALLADFVFKAMVATYIILIARRLMAYRTRLKDVFASTENRELTWIWVILVCMVFYFLANVAFTLSVLSGFFTESAYETWIPTLHSFALLGLFWALGIWGLRQRPGLTRQPVIVPPEPDQTPPRKYEKSALDDDRLQRIACKVEAAMTEDLLYRDPNLSLWDLAKHIGVTSHYVSQALNTQLRKNFFDLVNSWRIKEAIERLDKTDETILVIAYDVGFNSRSAFYKAFKRETGKTPSELRK